MAKGKKTGGRVAGVPNKATGEVAERCRALIEAPDYQASFQQRLADGTLPPALEAMTWHYAHGKPIERQELSGPNGGAIPVEVHDHFAVIAPR